MQIAKQNHGIWIALALFTAALVVRLILASQVIFPPLDDPAFYIQAARHLAAGRGFVTDVIWNYFVPFKSVTHLGNEFWMPAASLLMAGTISVLGDTLFAAQLPGILSGAALAPITYFIGCRLWPQHRRWSVFAAVLLIPSAILAYQSVSADSAALFALLGTLTLWSAAEVYIRHSAKWATWCGVLCGLSYLTRSHGSLLIIAIGLAWAIGWRHTPRLGFKLIGIMLAATLLVVAPWWLRNLSAFGSIQPMSLLTAAAARDYGEWFNYTDLPAVKKILAAGLSEALNLRGSGWLHCLSVILLITFPYGVLGLPMAVWRREPLFRIFAGYGVLLWFVAGLIFTVPSLTGSFYHSAGVYAPWAALGCAALLGTWYRRARWRSVSLFVGALTLALVIGQLFLASTAVSADARSNQDRFQAITAWLQANVPPDQPILTTQAHTLNYTSGYPALSIPVAQDADVLRQVADRYGVRYVVVTRRDGLYPEALDAPEARARLIAILPETWIYELLPR